MKFLVPLAPLALLAAPAAAQDIPPPPEDELAPMDEPPVEPPAVEESEPTTEPVAEPAPAPTGNDIVTVAAGADDFATLAVAIKAAGLVEPLSTQGPLTVFAPVDAAFEALPAGTLDTLMAPENQPQLQALLAYHVVAGALSAADLAAQVDAAGGSLALDTLQGSQITVTKHDNGLSLADAQGNSIGILSADITADNGVIHAIDRVLTP